jgi:hypothetical protein
MLRSDAASSEIRDLRNTIRDLEDDAQRLETEKHVLEAALYEVAEIVADNDLDSLTKMAQLSMVLSGCADAGLIDPDTIGTDAQPEVSEEYLKENTDPAEMPNNI